MTRWYCDTRCKISKDGAGPWSDGNKEFFFQIKSAHSKCTGFQVGEPKLRGKANWGVTEIEKEATRVFNQNTNRWFHELIAFLKGPTKCCIRGDSNDL